jgi:transcriptional regulator with XRE-family HTH domain
MTTDATDNARGERLRAYRKAKQLTLQGLADLTGLRVETISRIERGKQKLGHRSAYYISKALDVDFDYLMAR